MATGQVLQAVVFKVVSVEAVVAPKVAMIEENAVEVSTPIPEGCVALVEVDIGSVGASNYVTSRDCRQVSTTATDPLKCSNTPMCSLTVTR